MYTFKIILALFVTLCFYDSGFAMDVLVEPLEGVRVDIPGRVWSEDYRKSVDSVKDFDLGALRSQLALQHSLPLNVTQLQHLLYLSTITRANPERTPFVQKKHNKFYIAYLIQRSVPWVFGINAVVILITGLVPVINFTALAQCSNTTLSNCLSQATVIALPNFFSVVGSIGSGFLSLYSTGISTDLASRKADDVQDKIDSLRSKYATLAKFWVDIFFAHPQKAQYIADNFDIKALRESFQANTYNKKLSKSLTMPLKEACHYIKYGTVLVKFTQIESYLYNKIQEKKIVELTQQYQLLEKRLLLLEQK